MTIETNTFIKNNFLGLIILLLIGFGIILFFRSGCGTTVPIAGDTVTKRRADTTINRTTVVLPDQSKPQAGATVVPIYVPQRIEPAQDISGLTKQVQELIDQNAKLIQKLGTESTYNDTTEMRDSTGFLVGKFNLTELVKNNELARRSKSYTVNARTITNTVTNTIKEPYMPKNQVYFGGNIAGDQDQIINRAGIGLLFKNKKDRVLQLNATVNSRLKLGGEVGLYTKIF